MKPQPIKKRRSYVRRRLSEPSTHAGIGAIAALLLPFVPPQYQAVAAAVGALAGAVAVLKGDPGTDRQNDTSNAP